MTNQISIFLRNVGFRATYAGFPFLVCAISLVILEEDYLRCLTKRLYPDVARRFGVSPAAVEHDIRSLFSAFWTQGNGSLLEKHLGYPLRSRPFTGEFIDILASSFLLSSSACLLYTSPSPRD